MRNAANRVPRSGTGDRLVRAGGLCLRATLRVCTILLVVTGAGLALLGVRLAQGPVAVPPLASALEAMARDEAPGIDLEIGAAVFSLGSGGETSGLSFRDVRLSGPDGAELASAPEVRARFRPMALLQGAVRPVELTLIEPHAAILRAEDGRIRAGIGAGQGPVLSAPDAAPQAPPERPGMDLVARIIDGLVGDAPPVPGFEELERIAVLDATLIYADALTGRTWRTRGSDLTIERDAAGLAAQMRVSLTDDAEASTRIRLSADRAPGNGDTEVRVFVSSLQPDDLAEQMTGDPWIRLVDAEVYGGFWAVLGRDGTARALEGRLAARDGRLLALGGADRPFEYAAVSFALEPGTRRLRIEPLEVEGPELTARLEGHVTLSGPDPFAPRSVAADLRLEETRVALDEVFAGPLDFDRGALVVRYVPGSGRLDLAEARLGRGDMQVSASGRARLGPDDWTAALRLSGRGLTVGDLKAHWPPGAAANARVWVAENLIGGEIPRVVADFALGGAERPRISMAFTFRDLATRYLDGMTPIEGGRGRGTLTFDDLFLEIEEAEVRRAGAGPIRLGGSRVAINDLWGDVTPADITVEGEGPTAAILGLLDEPPLALVGKLGLAPGAVGGRSGVTANLAFPLLDDLLIEEIDVDADATLRDVTLPLDFAGMPERRVTSERLSLEGTTAGMTVAGSLTLDGQPVDIRWREDFGGASAGRTLEADLTLTPERLASLGYPVDAFRAGRIPAEITLEQRGGAMRLSVAADLGPASLGVAPLRWSKPEGTPGRVSTEAEIGDDGYRITAFSLEGGGLSASGTARLGADGRLVAATLPELSLDGRADLRAEIGRDGDGTLTVGLAGPFLDLSTYLSEPPEDAPAEGAPIRISVDIERLRLTPKFRFSPARGTFRRSQAGALALDLSGAVGQGASFEGSYSRGPDVPGEMSITAPSAGAFLSGIGLFHGGEGGRLELEAAFAPGADIDVAGAALIEDMIVRNATTFGSILEEGGAGDAAEQVGGGGLRFDSIDIPFQYRDGVLTLEQAIARSTALALKVSGEVDEQQDVLDLYGVISPAYGITGALDRVPVLGAILSGGRGEGILAMTFRVTGTLDDPRFRVNPLSLLTPGFLRNVFEGAGGEPSQRFLDQLGRGN